MNDAVFGEAAEHGVGLGVRVGWGFGFGGVGAGFGRRVASFRRGWAGSMRTWGTRTWGWGAIHSPIHGLVGEAVGVLVFVAEGVGDLEGFESGDAVSGLLPEGAEVRGVDFVLALDLLHHEFGVGDDAEAGVVVVEGVLEAGEEAGVLGEVVGSYAEELAEFSQQIALVVLDDGSVAGRTGVAAGSAVAVGVDPDGLVRDGLGGAGFGRGCGVGKEAGCGWGAAGHRKSLREC